MATEESFDLAGDSQPIVLAKSKISIIAPGLKGLGRCLGTQQMQKTRALTSQKTIFDKGLAEAGLQEAQTILIDAPTRKGASGRNRKLGDSDRINFEIPT